MKRVALDVETLRCEADEAEVLDELLSREGIIAAEVDLENERVSVAFDDALTTKLDVINSLRFFGLSVRREALASSA